MANNKVILPYGGAANIARELGIHPDTIRKVLRGKGEVAVAPETKQRILQAAKNMYGIKVKTIVS